MLKYFGFRKVSLESLRQESLNDLGLQIPVFLQFWIALLG